MKRTAIAAVLTLAVSALAIPWLTGTVAPIADAQSPPSSGPGVPVTA